MCVDINGTILQMKIDTSSALTLTSQVTFSKFWSLGNTSVLKNTPVSLRTYSGEELNVVGSALIRVYYGGKVVLELELVVSSKGPSFSLEIGWVG